MSKTNTYLFLQNLAIGLLILFMSLFIYTNILDLVLFNEWFLGFDLILLESLYYLFPAVVLIGLSVLLYFIDKKLNRFSWLQVFGFAFTNTILFVSLFILTGVYCDDGKNLSTTHRMIFLVLILFSTIIQLLVLFSSKKKRISTNISVRLLSY